MTPSPAFLLYFFNGWKLEFHADYFDAVNPVTQNTYRVEVESYADMPFVVTLIERKVPRVPPVVPDRQSER